MSERIPDVSARIVTRATEQWTTNEYGRVIITKRKFGAFGTRMLKLFRIPGDMVLTLDPIASHAWNNMDGRTVADVLIALEKEFPDQEGLSNRLGQFLGTLVSNDLVGLA